MTYTNYPALFAIKQALKPDERIVCTNATVVMDKDGKLTYFDNDSTICVIDKGE